MNKALLIFCIGILSIFNSTTANAQLKIGTGYDFSYSSYETLNETIANYNAKNPDALIAMKEMHINNGIVFNFRYEIEFVGIEAGWIYRFNESDATLDESNTLKLLDRFQTFSLGLDNRISWISFGGSIDYDIRKINAKVNDINSNINYFKDNSLGATIYLGLNTIDNPFTNISFRPFIKIPITDMDYNELDFNMNGENTLNDSKGKPVIFGFKLIFVNG